MPSEVFMHRGHRTPPDKKEQAIALAQTSLTVDKIAAEVGVSRRTLGRIWKKAGISRKSDGLQKGEPELLTLQVSGRQVPSYSLRAARIREHSDYLREQFKCMAAQIWVPEPARSLSHHSKTAIWPPTDGAKDSLKR